jgi:hypothetical protein
MNVVVLAPVRSTDIISSSRHAAKRDIRTEIKKQLEQSKASNECTRLVLKSLEGSRYDPEHERSAEEADKLNWLSAEVLDSDNREVVSG